MSDKKIIYYIDDDEDTMYTLGELEQKFSKKGYSVEFLGIINEKSKEDFLENLYSKEKYGVILDYDLANSNIYGDAIELWETIKKQNPFFPVCIYTSHSDDVQIDPSIEKKFSKDGYSLNGEVFTKEDEIDSMLEYIDKQVKLGIENINTLERVNQGLKKSDTFSTEVAINEIKIEHQFSIKQPRLLNDDIAGQLDDLIAKAYQIIDEAGEM
ncbi:MULTISPECIES: hypothetical protein [Streptococcus]|jgi:hypothetical protein|uniref:Response regulator n=1 Tax=Streptococcus mitis TaxID=28037 RepID=A0A1X1L5N5_STRMT|nr:MULTISPECIES: hypothetical protein [Streptococcus]MCY7160745.1 hypothetical protein [Streptococcus mitis]MDU7139749.1 hypothetical protein [Streptococcus mitis]ORP06782.1 hypothetical protein B7694_00805 [Streptococcus mitis]RSJ90148.1 hypothetical protein D8789_04875 [Streptococcus mitis]TKD52768.1 hypothetical protein FBF73_03325 [Streptococcus mitis]